MRELDQTILDSGKGNALQACVASYFDCDHVNDVPNFIAGLPNTTYLESINVWLSNEHPNLVFAKFELLDNKLAFPTRTGTLVLIAGLSPRGDHKHVVLARVAGTGGLGESFEVVHDPFPEASPPFLRTFEWVGLFVNFGFKTHK